MGMVLAVFLVSGCGTGERGGGWRRSTRCRRSLIYHNRTWWQELTCPALSFMKSATLTASAGWFC